MARGVFAGGVDLFASELNDCFDPPRCRARHAGAAQVISTGGVGAAIGLDTDTYDVGAMHDTAVNNSRFTVPANGAGLYVMTAGVEIAANATGRRELSFRVNGATFIASARDSTPSASHATRLTVATEYRLAVGDYVEAMIFQNSGGNLSLVVAAEYTPFMTIRWVAI